MLQSSEIACGLPSFWRRYSLARGNSLGVNGATMEFMLKAPFNLVPADIMKNYGEHLVPSGK